MKTIKPWDNFVNERVEDNVMNELETLLFLPLKDRKDLEVVLKKMSYAKESLNEGFLDTIKLKLSNWLTEKAMRFLIKNRERMLPKMLEGLKVLDPTDLTGIDHIDALYLGGGIDFATDANGWRQQVEKFFGEECVVRGEDIINVGLGKKINTSKFGKPLIFNPLNNEPERDADTTFSKMFQKWKKGDLNTSSGDEDWNQWVDEINKEIKLPDLHILNFCDSNLIKYDKVAGDGTKAELQVSDWKNHYIFLWLGEKAGLDGQPDHYTIKNISPWTIPACTKILRNDEEAWIFLNLIKEKFGK
jgi:hypothetical protein